MALEIFFSGLIMFSPAPTGPEGSALLLNDKDHTKYISVNGGKLEKVTKGVTFLLNGKALSGPAPTELQSFTSQSPAIYDLAVLMKVSSPTVDFNAGIPIVLAGGSLDVKEGTLAARARKCGEETTRSNF